MGEVEDDQDPLWKFWNQFMKQAGLSRSYCLEYATSFNENDVKMNQLTEAVEKDNDWIFVFLKRVGVQKVGHAMKICTEARKLGCSSSQTVCVELFKIDEEDEARRVGGGDNIVEEEDGEGTRAVGEGGDEPRGGNEESIMVGDDCQSPGLVRQACKHGPRENCVDCIFCNKHLNTKSLPRHILDQHQLLTVPVSKKKISNSSSPTEPVAGGQFSALQSSSDEENHEEDNIGIVPPPTGSLVSVMGTSTRTPSVTVQGMLKAKGKEGLELRSVEVTKKPIEKKRVSEEDPILIKLKKVKKLKYPKWYVVEPRTKSTQQASQTKSKEKSGQANSVFQKVVIAPDFVTGTSRFGRERKRKLFQSY